MNRIHLSFLAGLCFVSTLMAGSEGVFPAQGSFLFDTHRIESASGESWALFSGWSRWEEEGRGLLSQAEVDHVSAGAGILLAGEYYVEFSLHRWEDELGGPYPYEADGSAFRAEAPVGSSWRIELSAGKKDYEKPEAEDVNSFGAGAKWYAGEKTVLSGRFSRQPEIHNVYAILQGIESDSWVLAVEHGKEALLRAELEYMDYNDDNAAFRGLVAFQRPIETAGRLTPSVKAEYRDAREKSYLLLLPGGGILGMTHPYWAPRQYTAASFGLDYQAECGRYGAVSASASLTYDTDKDLGAGASLEWIWSCVTVAGRLYRSDSWDAEGISAGARFEF